MKKIINLLKEFIREDFGWHYLPQLLILIVLFFINYSDNYNLPNIHLFPFLVIFIAGFIFHNIKMNIRNILFILFALIIIWINYSTKFYFNEIFTFFSFKYELKSFIYKNFISIQKFLALCLPLIPIYLIQKKDLKNFYGLSNKGFEIKPYLIMLCIMIPFIFIAGESDSFQRIYPRYKPEIAENNGLLSEYFSITFFEIFYFFRFFAVEVFFRGFLVIGLSKLIDKKAILPIAILYSAWHFGKPLGEAIGAFFGGYILGILAYKTESIYGGIMIHYGVALLMELSAWYWILYG